jgi:hypothetical protein
MYKGEETKGMDFYNLLFESEEFTVELGKISLASGKLEAELILFLTNKGIAGNLHKATLGSLISKAKEKNLFDENIVASLEMICRQRNYITHNIYALFVDLLDETILEKNNLVDTDVITYIEKAWQLRENLNEMTSVIQKMDY